VVAFGHLLESIILAERHALQPRRFTISPSAAGCKRLLGGASLSGNSWRFFGQPFLDSVQPRKFDRVARKA
jgi:hypothetical protein